MQTHNIYSIESSNTQLGYYLAGLIEGDGNIWSPRTFKSPKGRIYNPQITFTFHRKEKPLFIKLKTFFGTGSLYQEKTNNTCKYRISETNTLIYIISLINGKFRTTKLADLHRAIDFINKKYNYNIEKLYSDSSNINSNAWLAGFVDADGHFQVNLQGKYKLNNSSYSKHGRIKCMFSAKQRKIDQRTGGCSVSLMTKIADHFGCNLLSSGPNELVFIAQANNKHHITIEYFSNYPLITSKLLDYKCFIKSLNYLGKRLTDTEIIEINNIKNSMNTKRTYFNWEHLNNIC